MCLLTGPSTSPENSLPPLENTRDSAQDNDRHRYNKNNIDSDEKHKRGVSNLSPFAGLGRQRAHQQIPEEDHVADVTRRRAGFNDGEGKVIIQQGRFAGRKSTPATESSTRVGSKEEPTRDLDLDAGESERDLKLRELLDSKTNKLKDKRSRKKPPPRFLFPFVTMSPAIGEGRKIVAPLQRR